MEKFSTYLGHKFGAGEQTLQETDTTLQEATTYATLNGKGLMKS